MQVMAIGVLQGSAHTCRHDLESFFYVFIWMCIRYGHESADDMVEAVASNAPKPNKRMVRLAKTSILRDWYTGTYTEIANTKRGHMVGFEDVTAEFATEFMSLKDPAENLRDALFPIRGKLSTGTYKDHTIVYDACMPATIMLTSRL
jgi:hypothetical protein